MAANTNFSLSSIDPDTLKQSFITFLQTQSQFLDYNYNGPNITVLNELLSRNSFLNSFYINMLYAESQLDSAQLRDSIVSNVKPLNYLPSSMTSSMATVNVQIQTSSGNLFVIPVGATFQGVNANGTYTFTTDNEYIQTSSNNTFNFSNVSIYEGTYSNNVFVVDNTQPNQRFLLSDNTIDISSLSIIVSENQGSTNNYFTVAENIYGLNGNSQVYYLQATENNQYEFYFGDGILGYTPQNGAIVTATYRVTFGDVAEDCSNFVLNYNLGIYNSTTIQSVVINTVANSVGGSQAEDIESIRFNAPRAFQTRENAVTSIDYKNLILKNFPQVGDVYVYGGNVSLTGVNYGQVFIAAVSPTGNPLTQNVKNVILSYLSNVAVIPLSNSINIVDANTLWIDIDTSVYINFSQTNNTPNYYELLTTNTIINFANTNLEKFNKSFVYSRFTDAIDEMDSNTIIVGNDTKFTLKRYTVVSTQTNNIINLSFNNPISSVTSSQFISNGFTSVITDSYSGVNIAKGTLSILQFQGNSVINNTNIGTVNYSTGSVSIPSIKIDSYLSNTGSFYFVGVPTSKIISANSNDIIDIDVINGLNINIIPQG